MSIMLILVFLLALVSQSESESESQSQSQSQEQQPAPPDIATQNCDPPTRISEDGRFTFQWCEDGGNLVDTKLNQHAYIFPGEKLQICAADGMCVFVDNTERVQPPAN